MPPHTQTFPCFHSTESAVQRLRVLSGQQTGRRRAGWRSGKSWALNFRNKLASHQVFLSCCLFISPLSTHPQTTRGSQSVFPPSSFLSPSALSSSVHTIFIKAVCYCISFLSLYPETFALHYFVICKPLFSKMLLLDSLTHSLVCREYWIHTLIESGDLSFTSHICCREGAALWPVFHCST